jgi:hypothetical protein
MLPTPDVVLHERILLCENRINDQDVPEDNRSEEAASVCGVLQLAAQKAVGCGGQEALAGALLARLLRSGICLLSVNDRTLFVLLQSQLCPCLPTAKLLLSRSPRAGTCAFCLRTMGSRISAARLCRCQSHGTARLLLTLC